MTTGTLSLWRGGEAAVALPAGGWRAVHVERGALGVAQAVLGADTSRALGPDAVGLTPLEADTRFWLWDWRFAPEPAPAPPPGLVPVLDHAPTVDPADPRGAVLLRLERVDLPAGSATAPHTHAGCGLRVLIRGAIDAELGARRLALAPGDAWLERGPGECVVGRVGPDGPAAFVRLMVLPAGMAGQDSYRPWGGVQDSDRPWGGVRDSDRPWGGVQDSDRPSGTAAAGTAGHPRPARIRRDIEMRVER